ncbi:GIN domain-containing protein [Flagellimonas nanhaiensis]|uniref:Putative auto-transporter adhesin head GIN domain-containing protein n=1 Tax=Flagellimonas nanhaiensis TaxID=2292706 RepID=A0A371JTZ4_9FLAO|nr:DUF2807 domain-containing protein [Allomuricauda nanhaiensis]RDY61239.1 hypothetical protein DX873_03470 [Allomuricauda nanhaiensis]
MKKSNLILLGGLASIFFFSLIFQLRVHSYVKEEKKNQKTVQIVLDKRDVPHFTSILAEGRMKVVFNQQSEQKLEIHAPNYVLDSISTKVANQILKIKLGKGLKKKDSIILHVSQEQLHGIALKSNVHFETVGQVYGDSISIDINDESSANLNLAFKHVAYGNSSSGEVNLKGEIATIEIKTNQEEE